MHPGETTVAESEPRPLTRSRSLGQPTADLDRALLVAGHLEDDELVRRLGNGRDARRHGRP